MNNDKDDIIYSIALDLDKIAAQQKQLDEVVNKLANGQKKLGDEQKKTNAEMGKGTIVAKENSDSMAELGERIFGNVAKLTAVALAVKGLEKAFDIFIEGEQAHIIEKNFEQMADSVDVDSKRLIASLKQAAGGLVDDTDLMQQATLSLMQMGKQAERLPELISLAKKASYATGKDIQEVIQGISFALETGNTRALKQYRLMVDSEKATREYARQHGVAVSHLDEAGKRAAIMNAVLDEGKKKYSTINTEQQNTLMTWRQLTISIKQFFEEVGKLVSKTVGPAFKYFIEGLTSGIRGFTEMLSEKPKQRIREIKKEIEDLENGTKRLGMVDMFKRMVGGAAHGKEKIAELRTELARLESESSTKKDKPKEGDSTTQEVTGIDKDKIIKDQSKVNQEILALRKTLSEQMAQHAITDETVDQAKNARIVAAEQEVRNKIQGMKDADQYTTEQRAQIEAQLYKNLATQKEQFALEAMTKKEQLLKQEMDMASNEENLLSSSLKRKEILEQESIQRIEMMRRQGHLSTLQMQEFEASERTRLNAGKMQVDEETERNKERLDKAGIASSQSFGEGFSRAAGQASKNAQKDLKDFGKQGTAVFGSLTKSISSHLEKWGSGEESAAEAAKGFVADFVADTAQMYGQMIMLVGLGDPKLGFTPNPQLIAAGAGLIALSGLVRGMAKRGGSSVGSGASGGGMESLSSREAEKPEMDEKAIQKRSVNITVQGSYFETDETKRKLVDMIRSEGDATDFKYNFVRG